MSQTSYSFDHAVAIAGMPVNAEVIVEETNIALEDMDFGKAAIRCDNGSFPRSVRSAKRNQTTLVFSADIVTSNSIAGTVNGVALTATVFATDHATTMAALGAKIVAALAALTVPIVATATVGGANNRTLTIDAKDGHLLLTSFVITLGGSQATITITNQTSDTVAQIMGITRSAQIPPRLSDGFVGYAAQGSVAVIRSGRVYGVISHDVVDGDPVYVDFQSGNEGKLTNQTTAPNVLITGARFRGVYASAGGIADIELNLPQG